MKCVLFFAIIGMAICIVELSPKKILVGKVADLVTGFLTESQISTSVDIIALDIHRMKQPEEIMSDLYDYLMSALTAEQLKIVTNSYKAMVKDLGDEGANDVLTRMKRIVAYGVSPIVEMVRISGETPEMAYMAMARQLTLDFVRSVVTLIKDTLTPTEWNSVKQHFGAMLRIIEQSDQLCEAAPKNPMK